MTSIYMSNPEITPISAILLLLPNLYYDHKMTPKTNFQLYLPFPSPPHGMW